jgi:signal transduction histidine kinase
MGTAVILLAYWLRDPLIPYGASTPGASGISADSAVISESDVRHSEAVTALGGAIRESHRNLASIAAAAVGVPESPEAAFDFLRNREMSPETGVIVFKSGKPFAWTGQMRNPPQLTGPGTTVGFSPFYVTLQVAVTRGVLTAIATSLLHSEAPADRLAEGIDASLPQRTLVRGFRLTPLSDTSADHVITDQAGRPLLRAESLPASPDMIRFARTASIRARGAIALGILMVILIAVTWRERRAILSRLGVLAIALVAVALVPWNNFSNFSRIFDPAYFFSPVGGPFTASPAAFMMSCALLMLAVIALVRARLTRLPRIPSALGGIILLVSAIWVASSAAGGIVLPTWGATAGLWIEWQVPLFLLLFAMWLAAVWLIKAGLQRKPVVDLRTAAFIALACGAISTFIVWTRTTEQRLQLAMRDVGALQRPDPEATLLLNRFGSMLADYDSAGTRTDLLKRYAASDLSAAGLQVALGIWQDTRTEPVRLDLAELPYDRQELASLVAEAMQSEEPIIHQSIGPTGHQVMLAVPHHAGGVTTAVATPRTRLVAENPYNELIGFNQPDKTEPPYTLILSDLASGGAHEGSMIWRRVGNEWHGDQIVRTSLGPTRAHVEIDLRSWPTRIVRAALIVVLDLAVAGILWALATMTEGGFVRWIRWRSTRWLRSYRGRLTLALFAFFVVPAVGFGVWSYQRLQRDDRGVRELLVRDILNAAAQGTASTGLTRETILGAPLFLYVDGLLNSGSDSLYEIIAPAGRLLPRRMYINISQNGELAGSARQTVAGTTMFWGYRAVAGKTPGSYVLAAPARHDELVLDRRRRDLTLLVLFATAIGAIAAFWLSGIAARVLARDLELSRIEVARAERVLAWGEMARQVAHEIKNPLTPIRLGVQHLRRAKSDPRVNFDKVLNENVDRILSEIDRLDNIARTFTRYGTAPGELPPPEVIDVAAILRDVVGLEKMGIGGVTWTLNGAEDPVFARARKDELRDVILNVFENARLARAHSVDVALVREEKSVMIHVADDGSGISSGSLPRVFEPHFSTRTTGSGLGLAISRRLLESWGGEIDIESEEGSGARVTITLQAAQA